MHLTVEQALAVYPLSEGKLIAGGGGRTRVVKSVNVMDAPDIADWIKEGEMLFTTAYLIKDDPEEATAFLHKLYQRGASGLGIKLGRFWTSIPEALVRKADELGFPLIELPYAFTFSDQMNGLFNAELRKSTGILQDVLDKQVRLMRFALRSDHVRELFETVAEVIGEPIAVIGSRGQIVYNGSENKDADLLADWPWSSHGKWLKTEGWQAFSMPLMKSARCTGHVLFFTPRIYLSAIEESLYSQAAELLSFHLNFNYEDYLELSIQRDFGQMIKRHLRNGMSCEALESYAAKWELSVFEGAYRCVLTVSSSLDTGERKMECLEALKNEFLSHALIQGLSGTHVVLEEGLLSLFPERDAVGGEERLTEALTSCLSGMKGELRGSARCAISSRKKKAVHLAEAYRECGEAHRLSMQWGLGGEVVRYETLDFAYIFEQVSRERMTTYCDRLLAGLEGKDPDYVQEMMRTLETYLDNDGQLNETAKKLFIHRNTATYRIEKLGELLDVDFKRINDLLRLKLVFQFRKLLAGASIKTGAKSR
ncbi:PucR family transcriptional regulator [Cohnella hashimotonis]|uniref:PucR family transcriptional regulator n=1 Tax=Cohnella hashimotonis TaxID=2826895 RepID=A0ABT6TJ07_9BACL|nr:PucR family transcriptional regulator [Cohnella hashimotonis]MDI4646268.1 PucR family transcriptional regulator [Cohnella hashimotonis]